MDGHLSGWIDESGADRDQKERIVIISYTENGEEWTERLYNTLSEEYDVLCAIHSEGAGTYGRRSKIFDVVEGGSLRKFHHSKEILQEEYGKAVMLLFVCSAGTAVRELAPFLENEMRSPAVLVMDDMAMHVISLLPGHLGAANEWCREISAMTGAEAVITTATDLHGRFSGERFAEENHLEIENPEMLKEVSKRVLRSQPIGVYSDFEIRGRLPKGFFLVGKKGQRKKAYAMHPECGIVITADRSIKKKFEVECRMFMQEGSDEKNVVIF
ncbi:MAG: hypothetical protein IJJ13_07785 [Lachnospiraceae bacterium]|nr:hypothetical protein [Lachnospiraceae bacterium]